MICPACSVLFRLGPVFGDVRLRRFALLSSYRATNQSEQQPTSTVAQCLLKPLPPAARSDPTTRLPVIDCTLPGTLPLHSEYGVKGSISSRFQRSSSFFAQPWSSRIHRGPAGLSITLCLLLPSPPGQFLDALDSASCTLHA